MKKSFICMLASAMLLSTGSFYASAYDSDAVLTMPKDAQQSAEAYLTALEHEKASSSVQTYGLTDASGDISDFSGYDLEQAYTVFTASMYSRTKYWENHSFSDMLSPSTVYVIPYSNENCSGDIWMKESEETGTLEFVKRTIGAPHSFEQEQVEDIVSSIDNVTEVKLVQDWLFNMNMIYITTDEEEYIVPCTFTGVNTFGEDITSGVLYTTEEFMTWVENGFDWENHDGMTDGSGIPAYIGWKASPAETVQNSRISETAVLGGLSALSFAAAGGLTVCGVKSNSKKRLKHQNKT